MSGAQRMSPKAVHVRGLESLLVRMLAVLEETLATGRSARLLGKQSGRGVKALPVSVQRPIQLLVLRSAVGRDGAVKLRRPRSKIERAPRVLKRVKGVGQRGLRL